MSTIADFFDDLNPYTFCMEMSTIIELDRNAIGTVIRRLRKEKRLSQEVLSGFASLARSHLAMIETGDKVPNFETIWRIAAALELRPYELVKMIEAESTVIKDPDNTN